MQVRVLSTMGRYIEAYCIDGVARSVLRVAPVSVFQYGKGDNNEKNCIIFVIVITSIRSCL